MKMILAIIITVHSISSVSTSCSTNSASPTCLFTEVLPQEKDRFLPSIGNGLVGTIVLSDTIHVAGVYNGNANITYKGLLRKPLKDLLPKKTFHKAWTQNRFVAHRARIPSTAAINFTLDIPGHRSFALDVELGVFYQWFNGKSVQIIQRIFAHRVNKNVIVNEITVQTEADLILRLDSNRGEDSHDITFRKPFSLGGGYKATVGKINQPEMRLSKKTQVAVVWTPIPKLLRILKSETTKTFRFLTSIASSLESSSPLITAIDAWETADLDKHLFETHAKEWQSLWNNASIDVKGNLFLSQLISSSLYYTLSSVDKDSLHGISPGGLAGGEEYLGHVFWDQDVWMYPPMLMLHPDIGKSLLEYRYERLEAAKDIAKKYGYEGAMYPWESALTGYEVCPAHVYGFAEIHINGDIAFAMRQFYYATGDFDWLKEKGYQVIFETAKFWASRVTYDVHTDRYVIYNVMPPDEYAYPVNNSIYTNTIAKLNIELAVELGRILKVETPNVWDDIASKMYLPFDSKLLYHPEYQGFDITQDTVKQADTILINYPLMFPMEKNVKENDLKYYANVTDPGGPAMTHSMFTIGWLDIGNKKMAREAFEKNYENLQGPFKVWSEINTGEGATNFLTGAGGFLQAVIFGYGGLRLRSDGLYFDLQRLPGTSEVTYRGVKYMGNSIDFHVVKDGCYVGVSDYLESRRDLVLKDGGKTYQLIKNHPVVTCAGKIFAEK